MYLAPLWHWFVVCQARCAPQTYDGHYYLVNISLWWSRLLASIASDAGLRAKTMLAYQKLIVNLVGYRDYFLPLKLHRDRFRIFGSLEESDAWKVFKYMWLLISKSFWQAKETWSGKPESGRQRSNSTAENWKSEQYWNRFHSTGFQNVPSMCCA